MEQQHTLTSVGFPDDSSLITDAQITYHSHEDQPESNYAADLQRQSLNFLLDISHQNLPIPEKFILALHRNNFLEIQISILLLIFG